jgi:hypothetical protein
MGLNPLRQFLEATRQDRSVASQDHFVQPLPLIESNAEPRVDVFLDKGVIKYDGIRVCSTPSGVLEDCSVWTAITCDYDMRVSSRAKSAAPKNR